MSGTRVGRARLWRVKIPLEMVYVSSMYVMRDTTRTIIELESEDGRTVGLGEAHGTEEVFGLAVGMARDAIGLDPRDRRRFSEQVARSVFDNRNGRSGWSAAAGVELALWDLLGRQVGLPFAALLGGGGRRSVDVVCPVPSLMLDHPVARADLAKVFDDAANVEPVVRYAAGQASRFGFRSFKYKSAAARGDFDVAVMTGLRAALPGASLRFDPNAGYPPAEAAAVCRRLEPLGLEFYEDPTDDQEGLARIRSAVRTPVATNMCVIQVDQLAAAARRPPVDVILADLFLWGGPLRFRTMVHAATALGFEVAIHSLFETGIGTAANLQLAAAFPEIRRANDSGLHVLGHDVIEPGVLSIHDGAMTVPDGPGLGVTLDQSAVEELAVDMKEVTR